MAGALILAQVSEAPAPPLSCDHKIRCGVGMGTVSQFSLVTIPKGSESPQNILELKSMALDKLSVIPRQDPCTRQAGTSDTAKRPPNLTGASRSGYGDSLGEQAGPCWSHLLVALDPWQPLSQPQSRHLLCSPACGNHLDSPRSPEDARRWQPWLLLSGAPGLGWLGRQTASTSPQVL